MGNKRLFLRGGTPHLGLSKVGYSLRKAIFFLKANRGRASIQYLSK